MLQKITDQQMDEKGVSSAPNVLSGTAAENKRVFDKLIRQVVSVLFNQLVDALTATTGAKEIGADVPTVTTKTVQAILSAFDKAITDRYTKTEVDSLTSQETTNLVENVDVNLTTGVMTITKKDGTVTEFDTALEKVPATFELKDIGGAPTLVVTNVDGSTSRLPVDTLVDTYIFKDSTEIDFEVTGDDDTKTVTAEIRPASIDESKLSLSATTYLEGMKKAAADSASAAAESEDNATKSAMTAKGWAQGGTNTHPDEEQNNSKYWAEQAADSAEAAGSAAIAAETSDNNAADNAKAAGSAAINAADSAQAAVKSRTLSESYAHGRTAMRPGEEEDNAKYYMERAKEIVGGDFATRTQAQEYANTAESNANQHSDDALSTHEKDTASHLTDGAQTLKGVKTFKESPVVPEPKKPENPLRLADVGAPRGVPQLDENKKVLKSQLPQLGFSPRITVTGPTTGSTVTATKGECVITGTENPTGVWAIDVTDYGDWVLKAEQGTRTTEKTVSVQQVQNYPLTLKYIAVYGVEWETASPSTQLTRTDDAVGFADPVPAVGTGSGSSPFDSLYPWSEMEAYNIDPDTNTIGPKQGESGFSKYKDTFVKIPKFWFRVTRNGTKIKYEIAEAPVQGFFLHPAFSPGGVEKDAIYSGRYSVGQDPHTGKYMSVSNEIPSTGLTRKYFREKIKERSSKLFQHWIVERSAIQLLYLVEFADWNCQRKIGAGYVSGNTGPLWSGKTDSMVYHTGQAAGVGGKTAVQYRHLENLWGNVYSWLDGYNERNRIVYIAMNPADCADETSVGHTAWPGSDSIVWSNNYAKDLVVPGGADNWLFAPKTDGGSDSTHIPDLMYYYQDGSSWYFPRCGGYWTSGSSAGLWRFYGGQSGTYSSSSIGSRMLYIP